MERLTKVNFEGGPVTYRGCDLVGDLQLLGYKTIAVYVDEVIRKLSEYEDSGLTPAEVASMARLKAAGKLKLMPCAIGDTVYEIRIKYTKKLKGRGKAYDYSCIGHPGSLKYDPASCYVAPKICTKTDLLHIGKMVYTTEQEAIEVLEEAKRSAKCHANE